MGRRMIDGGKHGAQIVALRQYLDADRALGRGRAAGRAARRWRSPSRSSPAAASRVASYSPRSTFASRVWTLPRIGAMARSGRRASNCAARRGDEVPTRAPSGKAARLSAPISRSPVSARGSIAAMTSVSGRIVSTSFIEWTERSVRPSASARSSSLVQSALPPSSASGRSWIRSPEVVIGTISVSTPLGRQRLGDHPRLGERERRAAGADAKGAVHSALVLDAWAGGREAGDEPDPRHRIELRRDRGGAGDLRPAHSRPPAGRAGGRAPPVRRRRPRDRGARACRDPAGADRGGAGRGEGRTGRRGRHRRHRRARA